MVDWSFGVPPSFKIAGVIFFIWSMIGFTSAVIDNNPVNFMKAIITLIVAWFFYFVISHLVIWPAVFPTVPASICNCRYGISPSVSILR